MLSSRDSMAGLPYKSFPSHFGRRGMSNDKNSDLNSPLSDYLIGEERAHGRKSREIFRAQDLRDSLVRESSESMALKSKDDKGKEAVKGKAKVRYEANRLFSVIETQRKRIANSASCIVRTPNSVAEATVSFGTSRSCLAMKIQA
jgi:hypothetical protein